MRTVRGVPVRTSVFIALVAFAATGMLLSATPKAQNAGQPQVAPGAGARPAGNAATGKQLYKSTGCFLCHGYEGQGSVSVFANTAGRRLAPSPMPFRGFVRFVRAPREMPPYSEKALSEQNLADIYAFLLTIPPPPDVDSIPLLAPSQFAEIAQTRK